MKKPIQPEAETYEERCAFAKWLYNQCERKDPIGALSRQLSDPAEIGLRWHTLRERERHSWERHCLKWNLNYLTLNVAWHEFKVLQSRRAA
jgi:hypothetical protein